MLLHTHHLHLHHLTRHTVRSLARASRLLPALALAASLALPQARALHVQSATAPAEPAPGPRLLRTVSADAFPPLRGGGDRRFGVVQSTEDSARADDLHIGWTRVQIRWDLLQRDGPDTWDVHVTGFDRPIDREIAHGRQVVGEILGVPRWAALNPSAGSAAVPRGIDLPWTDPRNAWGQFIYRAVRHYRGRIDVFTILNEVEIKSGTYHQFTGTPQQYAQMLRVAYLAAHAANPHVEIHLYGDSVYADYGQTFAAVLDALERFPDARANGCYFDAAEVHLYRSVLRWQTLIPLYHHLMAAHGCDRPIWLSETNVAPRNDPQDPTQPSNDNADLAIQPNFLISSFAAALGLGLPRIEVYHMRDQRPLTEKPLGLVRADGTVRPEYYAVRTITRWFAGVTAARYDALTRLWAEPAALFRVVMERPGQEIQVLWDQGGQPVTATVTALSPTAVVVRPDGATRTIRARDGHFTLPLAAATDRSFGEGIVDKIGGTPLIVVQDLPRGYHVPGLHALPGEPDRTTGAGAALGPVTSVAVAPDGSGVRAIADTAHDRVLIEDAAGRVTARIGRTGGAPGQFRGPAGVAIGPDGTLYVADQGNARVQEFDLRGHLLGGFGAYDAGAASLHAPVAVATGPGDTVYVLDAAQDAVLRFSRQGQFLGRFGSPGWESGQLDGPGGLAVDAAGDVYVADTLNNRVQEFDPSGRVIDQIGTGVAGGGDTRLHWPAAVAVLPDGRVAVSDLDNGRVAVATHARTYLGAVALTGVRQPGGLAVAPDGSFWVSDAGAGVVDHLDGSGAVLGTLGRPGFSWGDLDHPLGLALTGDGDLDVANSADNRIEVFPADGAHAHAVGSYGHAAGRFVGPRGIALDRDGSIWIADTYNRRVQHLSARGAVLGEIDGINGPWDVAPDGSGGVYYTVRWDQRVVHVDRAGHKTLIGGAGTALGQFTAPAGLALGADGRTLYVADEGNRRVQILVDGAAVAQRGSASAGPGGLGDPVDVALGPDGSLYVLDAGRKRIVHYAGLGQGGFQALPMSGVPLALAATGAGLTVATCDIWSGAGLVRASSGDRSLATSTPTPVVASGTPTSGASTPGTATATATAPIAGTATATEIPEVTDTPTPTGTAGPTETPMPTETPLSAASATATSTPTPTGTSGPAPTATTASSG